MNSNRNRSGSKSKSKSKNMDASRIRIRASDRLCGVVRDLPSPIPTHTLRHSTRVEWLEWWKGWLLRSGAFPLWNA